MTAPFKVINVIDKGKAVSEWITPLESLLPKISTTEGRLAQNYSLENIKLKEHLSFDILVNQKNEIISFAGVYNGGRYPEGVYRVLNRTWVHEDYRVSHGAFLYLTSKYILPVQLERLKEHLKLVFVSRERITGRRFLLKWAQHQPHSHLWKVSEDFVQVVPNIEKKSCYQYICSRSFSDVDWAPHKMTAAQWLKLIDE
jgi:hypothetical protein